MMMKHTDSPPTGITTTCTGAVTVTATEELIEQVIRKTGFEAFHPLQNHLKQLLRRSLLQPERQAIARCIARVQTRQALRIISARLLGII